MHTKTVTTGTVPHGAATERKHKFRSCLCGTTSNVSVQQKFKTSKSIRYVCTYVRTKGH